MRFLKWLCILPGLWKNTASTGSPTRMRGRGAGEYRRITSVSIPNLSPPRRP